MILLLTVAVIVLLIWVYKLQGRIDKLEGIEPREVFEPVSQTEVAASAPEGIIDNVDRSKWPAHLREKAQTASAAATPSFSKTKASEPFDWENFLGRQLFPILGATSIVLAIGFFTVWAITNGWIGPMGQIAVGMVVSVIFLGLGEWARVPYPKFFAYLSATGLAGFIICTLVARHHYQLIDALPALLFLTAQTATGVLLTLRYDSRILGNFTVLSGLLAPWLSGQIDVNFMLPYVLVMSGAGFALATQKRWPEIFAVLLVLGTSHVFYAVEKLSGLISRDLLPELGALTPASSGAIDPVVLLFYIFALYGLIASAGIIRLARTHQAGTPPPEEMYELVLFTIALLLGNLGALGVFSAMDWSHFGFVVLGQALVLYGLADWFRAKGWAQFHVLSLCASLLFILLATINELQAAPDLILTLALLAEGVVLCAVGQFGGQKTFAWFGRAAVLLALFSYWSEGATGFVLQMLMTLLLCSAFIYSTLRPKDTADHWWMGLSLLVVTGLIFDWSLDKADLPFLLQGAAPAVWCLALIAAAQRFGSQILSVASGLVLLMLTLALATQTDAATRMQELSSLKALAAWIWVAIPGVVLYWGQKERDSNQPQHQILLYGSLILVTFSWLMHTGLASEEPLMTMLWIAGACVLMALGMLLPRAAELRYVGLGVTLLVISKLYLIDVWQWSTEIRFMAFAALGVALLGMGFFYQKLWLKK